MLRQPDSQETSRLTTLSPARQALSAAIEALGNARSDLERLHTPLSRLDRVLLAAQSVEAAGLRNEIDRLLSVGDSKTSGSADREVLGEIPPELLEAEQHLSKLAEGSADAGYRLSVARQSYVHAAERVRVASTERQEALWPAAVEAADADIYKLEEAIRSVIVIEARLRSLILALRETAHRGEPGAEGAFSAAEKIETKVVELRRKPMIALDFEIGRSLIDRLRSDPRATL